MSGSLHWGSKFINRTGEKRSLFHSGLPPLTQVRFRDHPTKPPSDCAQPCHSEGPACSGRRCHWSCPDPEPRSSRFGHLSGAFAQSRSSRPLRGWVLAGRGRKDGVRGPPLSRRCCLEAETTACAFPKGLGWGCWHLGGWEDLDQKPVASKVEIAFF